MITKPAKPTLNLTVTKKGLYVAEYERVVSTTKSAQQVGALLKREATKHVDELRSQSPVSTGLLKRSWMQYTETTIQNAPVKQAKAAIQSAGKAANTIKSLAPAVIEQLLKDERVDRKKVMALARLTLQQLFKGIPNGRRGKVLLALRIVSLLPGIVRSAKAVVALIGIVWLAYYPAGKASKSAEKDKARTVRLYVRISNRAPNSYYRLVGRAPGKQPPIDKLVNWAKRAKLPPSLGYVIARKIAKDGTERYRTGQNIVGVDPRKVQHRGNSSFVRMLDRINEAV